MDLKNYLKNKNRNEFALSVGTTLNYLKILMYDKNRRPSPTLALKIEQATGGAVSFRELLLPMEQKVPAGTVPYGQKSVQ